jgi:hypothetical protein
MIITLMLKLITIISQYATGIKMRSATAFSNEKETRAADFVSITLETL